MVHGKHSIESENFQIESSLHKPIQNKQYILPMIPSESIFILLLYKWLTLMIKFGTIYSSLSQSCSTNWDAVWIEFDM